jgi:hypothetical protein
MLVAAEKNKLKRKIKLWEDEATSTVFGPLVDMDPSEVWKVVNKMILASGKEENLLPQNYSPSDCEIKFWSRNSNVEPDVMFHFKAPNGNNINLLLEVKWRNGKVSPTCELIRQWLTRPIPSEQWFHIYLVDSEAKRRHDVDTSLKILADGCDNDVSTCSCEKIKFVRPAKSANVANFWKEYLGLISWRHMQKIVQQIEAASLTPCSLSRWAKGIRCFLEWCGYVPFVGFNWLNENRYQILEEGADNNLFIKLSWFSYLAKKNITVLDSCISNLNLFELGDQNEG